MIVYKATNLVNNKIYIGITTKALSVRIKGHINDSIKPKYFFQRAINKYGRENFNWEIIDQAETLEELRSKEIEYIKNYNSTDKNIGYNITNGGAGVALSGPKNYMYGKKRTEEQNEKSRQRLKGKTYEELYGPEIAKELKEKGRKRRLGKKYSVETIQKCKDNAYWKGKGHLRCKETHPMLGKHSRQLFGEANPMFGRRRKDGESWGMLGKTHSDEYKQILRVKFSGKNNPKYIDISDILSELLDLYSKGYTKAELARKYNISECTVTTELKAAGIVINHRRGQYAIRKNFELAQVA